MFRWCRRAHRTGPPGWPSSAAATTATAEETNKKDEKETCTNKGVVFSYFYLDLVFSAVQSPRCSGNSHLHLGIEGLE